VTFEPVTLKMSPVSVGLSNFADLYYNAFMHLEDIKVKNM